MSVSRYIYVCMCVCASSFVSCDLTWDWQEATDNNKGMHMYSTYPTMQTLAYTNHHIHTLVNPSAQRNITFITYYYL